MTRQRCSKSKHIHHKSAESEMSLFVISLVLIVVCSKVYSFRNDHHCMRTYCLHDRSPEVDTARNGEDSIWKEKVQYVDFTMPVTEQVGRFKTLPLFLLNGVFYPQGTNLLNIFEMKYRLAFLCLTY